MDDLGLLTALFPEVVALKSVTQSLPHVYDVFEHTFVTLDELEKIQARGYVEVANGEFIIELQSHFANKISAERERGTLLRVAALLHDIGKSPTRSVDDNGGIHFYGHEARGAQMSGEILRRLRFSNTEIEIVLRTVQNHLRPAQLARDAQISNRAIYRLFRDTGDAGIDTCVLALADWRGKSAPNIGIVEDAKQRAANAILLDRYFRAPDEVIAPPALIDGKGLMQELSLKPGKQIGELLEALREAQAAGEVKTRDDAIEFARKNLTEDKRRKTQD